jgi:ABC-type oligopeptide transport system ATPase subunit
MVAESSASNTNQEPLLCVRDLSKEYAARSLFSQKKPSVKALDNVSLTIPAGKTLAVVGESGSGKSTLARCLACLEEPTSGEVWLEGKDLLRVSRKEFLSIRPRIQLIFQDPAWALNPGLSAAEIITEPLTIQRWGTKLARRDRALQLMMQVGLSPQSSNRLSLDFSGGQRQRLAIARALAIRPRFLILDEALSSLDLSMQAQMVNLLTDLQAEYGLAYMYISHDLNLIRHIADRVAVMHHGKVVEEATTNELFGNPQHPCTKALLASIPSLKFCLSRCSAA